MLKRLENLLEYIWASIYEHCYEIEYLQYCTMYKHVYSFTKIVYLTMPPLFGQRDTTFLRSFKSSLLDEKHKLESINKFFFALYSR